jgi:hypothetical protein
MKTKTMAYFNNLDKGAPWVADYLTGEELILADLELSGSYEVIYQHAHEEQDQKFSGLSDGEVLLWHKDHGLIIAQSIDLNYL